jgi:hypothetical protein
MDVLNLIGVNWMVQKWNHNPSFHQKFLITTIYGFYAVLIFAVIIIVTSESNGESKIVIDSMSLECVIKKWGNFAIQISIIRIGKNMS